eukprot:m.38446 g.38446  ORF g.38446 m.38446 type:complete len:100 (-) comp11183_c0_seq1:1453-1752(-)
MVLCAQRRLPPDASFHTDMAIRKGDYIKVVRGSYEGNEDIVLELNGETQCTVDLGGGIGVHKLHLTNVEVADPPASSSRCVVRALVPLYCRVCRVYLYL